MPLEFDAPSSEASRDFARQLSRHDALAQAQMDLAHVAAEADTLHAKLAAVETERDTLRAALQEIRDLDHSPRCRWRRQHAGRAIRVDCDCHCMLARRALDGAR